MKVLIVIFLVVNIPVAFTRMLPQFSILQKMYLGDKDYGGVYYSKDVREYLFPKDKYEPPSKLKNATAICTLRISAVLNVTEKQDGSLKGVKDYYYFYKQKPLLDYLRREYGAPVTFNKTDAFRGQVGIIFVEIAGGEKSDDCSVLLWNGNGFHQAKGVIDHENFIAAHLWPAPTAGCVIDVNIKQSGGGICFPSKSQVELRSRKKIPISELAIGDVIKTFSKSGDVVFSPVVTFLDQMPDYQGNYYTITTEGNTKLTLSEAHLVFEFRRLRTKFGEDTVRSVHASQIKPGDYILVHVPKCDGPVTKRVIAISTAERIGAFAPVTQEGTMIVDGVWVSCYADIVDHDLADALMSPLKSFYNMAPEMLGARGKHVHGYLKHVLRPIGIRIFGKEKFYPGPDKEVSGGKETVITTVYN